MTKQTEVCNTIMKNASLFIPVLYEKRLLTTPIFVYMLNLFFEENN